MRNSKKTLFSLFGLILISIVGGTFAYFSSSAVFKNVFRTAEYGLNVIYEEYFDSPDNWEAGDITPKTLFVSNESDSNIRARVKIIKDEWRNGGKVLPKELSSYEEDVAFKDINLYDWVLEDDGYYYYQKDIPPYSSSSTFINSVTFHPKTFNVDSCTEDGEIGEGLYEVTCYDDIYSKAEYRLTLQVETIQSNAAYSGGWKPLINDFSEDGTFPSHVSYSGYAVEGGMITINGNDFIVLSRDGNIVRALATDAIDEKVQFASYAIGYTSNYYWNENEDAKLHLDKSKQLGDVIKKYASENGLNERSVTLPTKAELEGLSQYERTLDVTYWTRTGYKYRDYLYTVRNGSFYSHYCNYYYLYVRPVIIIYA